MSSRLPSRERIVKAVAEAEAAVAEAEAAVLHRHRHHHLLQPKKKVDAGDAGLEAAVDVDGQGKRQHRRQRSENCASRLLTWGRN
jgi:hypothetical protein